jgi:hypothetical protein
MLRSFSATVFCAYCVQKLTDHASHQDLCLDDVRHFDEMWSFQKAKRDLNHRFNRYTLVFELSLFSKMIYASLSLPNVKEVYWMRPIEC